MNKQIYTYREYKKDAEDLKGIDWSLLVKYVQFLSRFQEEFSEQARVVEEKPPYIDNTIFKTGGWVGTYKMGETSLEIIPDPIRLSLEEFTKIRNDLVGWLEHFGPLMEDLSKVYMNEAIFKRLLFAVYSKRLIEYTEILISQFIPREVNATEFVGPEIHGKPLWNKILFMKAKNSQLLVSRKIEFNIATLQNLLLTRFHAELLRDSNNFFLKNGPNAGLDEFLKTWKNLATYHEEFISNGIWSDLLEQSIVTDFDDSEVMERIRRAAKAEYCEIVDLWEAYKANKSFLVDFGKRFDIALKPLSKVYELWCFKKLCEIVGADTSKIREFPIRRPLNCKNLGKGKKLFYASPVGRHSGIMRKIRPRFPVGEPDFAIESDDRLVCVMDAKCKPLKNLNIGDMQRLLAYVLDYLYHENDKLTALIFYCSTQKNIKEISVKDCTIHFVPMTPTTFEGNKQKIESLIKDTL